MFSNNRLEEIDPYTTMHIRHKVKQLVSHGKFPRDMADDLVQELSMDFLVRRPRYNPAKSSQETFTVRIVRNKIASLLRAQKAQVRDFRRNECSLDDEVDSGEGLSVARHETIDEQVGRDGRDRQDHHHLAHDVRITLEGLPEDLRQLCLQLQAKTVSEVARDTGVPRTTIYESILKLRQRFQDAGLDAYLGRR